MANRQILQINLNLSKKNDVILSKFLKNLPYGQKSNVIYKALAFYVMNADIPEDDYFACFEIIKKYINKNGGNIDSVKKDIKPANNKANEETKAAPAEKIKRTAPQIAAEKVSEDKIKEPEKAEEPKPSKIELQNNTADDIDENEEQEMLDMLSDLDKLN